MAKLEPPPVTPEPEEVVAVTPSRRPLLLYAIAGLVLVVAVAAGGWLVARHFLGQDGHAAAEARPKEVEVRATVPMGAVVVNLAGETRRYLKVSVDLGVPAPADVKEIEERKPQILDLVIGILSRKSQDALMSDGGRTALKEEMLTGLRQELRLEKVLRVYFTEFVVQ